MAEREMKRDGREDNGEYSHRLLGERKGNGKRLEALGKTVCSARSDFLRGGFYLLI